LGPEGSGKKSSLRWISALFQSVEAMKGRETRGSIRTARSDVKTSHLMGSWKGRSACAGELALANQGLLLAHDLPLWSKDAKNALIQPLDEKTTLLNHATHPMTFASHFQLVATATLCDCRGLPPEYQSDLRSSLYAPRPCICSRGQRKAFQKRILGSLFDRMDLVIPILSIAPWTLESRTVPKIKGEVDTSPPSLLESEAALVAKAQDRWLLLMKEKPSVIDHFENHKSTTSHPHLGSMRKWTQWLRVALSICALEGQSELQPKHLTEASLYLGDLLWGPIPSSLRHLESGDGSRWNEGQRKSRENGAIARLPS